MIHALEKITLFAAAIFAVLLYSRAPSKRQGRIAWAIVGLFCLDVLRYVSTFLRAPPPYMGIARAAWAVSGAAALAWYAVTTWTTWTVLDREEPKRARSVIALPLLALPVALFAAYPIVRGPLFVAVVRGAFALALAAQILAAGRFAARGVRPGSAQRIALLLALSSFVDAFGPWFVGNPLRDWDYARWISVVTWIIVSGVSLWNLRRRTGS